MSKIILVNETKYLFQLYLILDKMYKKWSVFNQHTALAFNCQHYTYIRIHKMSKEKYNCKLPLKNLNTAKRSCHYRIVFK